MNVVSAVELPRSTGDILYEQKWDGFRAIAWVSPNGVRLQSKPGRDLREYFPDVCDALARFLRPGVVLDGELVIWEEAAGRTSFTLLQRRFRAGRRINVEAAQHP